MINCTDKAIGHHVNKPLTVFYNPAALTAKLNQTKLNVFWNHVQTSSKIYLEVFFKFWSAISRNTFPLYKF